MIHYICTEEEVFESKEEQIHFLQRVLNCLPDVNRDTLAEMVHLFEVVTKESTRQENRTEWAAIFGPSFLLRKGVHEYRREVAMSATLLQLIVDNASVLFSVIFSTFCERVNTTHNTQRTQSLSLFVLLLLLLLFCPGSLFVSFL
jgi:hypothetical protein